MSRARTWQSRIVGPTINWIDAAALADELVRRTSPYRGANTVFRRWRTRQATTDDRRLNRRGRPVFVRLGIVASLARPGGNLTGANFSVGSLTAKAVELCVKW